MKVVVGGGRVASLPTDPTNDVDRSTRASEATLAAINTKTPTLVDGRVPVDVGASISIDVSDAGFNVNNFPAVQPVSDNGGSLTVDGTVDVGNWPATQPVSAAALPLPTGAATEATLSTVATQTARNVTGTQVTGTATTTAATLTAPANAVGYVLQASSNNTVNLRYRIGAAATTTVGMQLEPGRNTGFVPLGADISIISESATGEYQVQWVAR